MNVVSAEKAAELREGVRATFDAVAQSPTAKYRFPVGPVLARQVGYPDDELSSLPSAASESFTGLAYLYPYLNLWSGERFVRTTEKRERVRTLTRSRLSWRSVI